MTRPNNINRHTARPTKYKKRHARARSTSHKQNSPARSPPQPLDRQHINCTSYIEQEIAQAQEQLWIVRRNLAYFRKFAALADDWRNFLPRKDTTTQMTMTAALRTLVGSAMMNATLSESQGYDLCATQSDTEAESNYEGSLESSDSENESGKPVASKRPPSKKAGKCTVRANHQLPPLLPKNCYTKNSATCFHRQHWTKLVAKITTSVGLSRTSVMQMILKRLILMKRATVLKASRITRGRRPVLPRT
jgi:hypothetical protein